MLAKRLIVGCRAGTAWAFILLSGVSFAQTTTSAVSGTIRDSSGAVLSGAMVEVRNLETGLSRTLLTDDLGRYYVAGLQPGRYQARASLEGFRAEMRGPIRLTVGREVVINFVLEVGEIVENIVVSAGAGLIESRSAALAGVVDEAKMRDLPLNGRDFIQLATLEAGVAPARNAGRAISKGFGVHISFSGTRPQQTGFLLDGSDLNNATNFTTPGSAARLLLGVETVREFQVLVSNHSAEFGRAAGGIINAVTRSGTNELHGSVFEFHRNDNLDARNFFDAREKPEFKRNQFGFTVGGPVAKDKTFFFGSYEGLRDRLGRTLVANVPSRAARAGLLRDGAGEAVAVADSIKPYLDLWPLPNGRDFGDGRAEFISSRGEPTREDFWVAKIDHSFTGDDYFFARYTFDDAETIQFIDPLPNFPERRRTRAQYLTIEEKKIFTPRLFNVFRFAYNRTAIDGEDDARVPLDPSLFFVRGGSKFGELRVPGLTNPGADRRTPRLTTLNLFQYMNDVTYAAGRHTIKAGLSAGRYQYNEFAAERTGGEYAFNSLEDFLRGRPDKLRLADPAARFDRHWRQTLWGFYIQNDWKVKDNLTLNLGLRYEFYTTPQEKSGLEANIRDLLRDADGTLGDPFFKNPSLENFAPRLGFAWDPSGSGRTSIRGGFGLYFDPILVHYYRNAGSRQPPLFRVFAVSRPTFPDALAAIESSPGSGAVSPQTIDWNARQPYFMQYSLSIQREVAPDTLVSASYVGARGVHLQRLGEGNPCAPERLAVGLPFFAPLPAAGDCRRLNPAFAQMRIRVQDAESFYNSLQMRINRRFSRRLQFQASYTLSKAVDDSSVAVAPSDALRHGGSSPNFFDPKFDRGLSNFHIGHNFAWNFTLRLPSAGNLDGYWSALFGGWQLSGIVALASGSPFSPLLAHDQAQSGAFDAGQRPDLTPGAASNPIRPGNPDGYFDASAFSLPPRGSFGNLGRNTLIGPGLANIDIGLIKNMILAERLRLQLRVEFFNLFNRANFHIPDENLFVFDQSGRIPSAGRITETTTASRQIQLAVKLIF